MEISKMNKIINIILIVLATLGFFVSFGLSLHMKWFLAIPVALGVIVLGLFAFPKIKEIYDTIFK